MEIKIEIENDDGELVFTDIVGTFEMAEMSLGQAERYLEDKKEKEEVV